VIGMAYMWSKQTDAKAQLVAVNQAAGPKDRGISVAVYKIGAGGLGVGLHAAAVPLQIAGNRLE